MGYFYYLGNRYIHSIGYNFLLNFGIFLNKCYQCQLDKTYRNSHNKKNFFEMNMRFACGLNYIEKAIGVRRNIGEVKHLAAHNNTQKV